jgi:uncharacterized protein (DUF983 family)
MLQKTNANDIAEYVAVIWLIVLLSTNIIVLLKQFGFQPLNYVSSFKMYALILFIPMVTISYFLFLRNKRYLVIAEQYANETKREKIKGNLILIAYVVATFGALVLI